MARSEALCRKPDMQAKNRPKFARALSYLSTVDPSQAKFLSLESMKRGIASMSAGDEALRNATVAHSEKPRGFAF
ncbi:MAG TPA: hypothetical protein VFC58_08500 [Desulfosporosinus sp.]|nr:hypothetical protein [Desulfosporosinus sp.]